MNEDDVWKMVMENVGIARKHAHAYCRRPQDYEDLYQCGILGLFIAAKTFNPLLKLSFGNWAYWWVRKYVNRYYVKSEKECEMKEDDRTECDYACDARIDIEMHMQILNERERMVIRRRWLEGNDTLDDVAKEMGITRAGVAWIEKQAMNKMRRRMR